MRKQTKLVAVLSAAALLAIGASMTSFAGWAEEDGVWVYLDKDGDRVYDTWEKSGNRYFYLDENGEMATEMLIDTDDDGDLFYVDANGAKVVNSWISVDNEESIEIGGEEVDTIWYYFGSNGKAVKGSSGDIKVKELDYSGGKAKYLFDEEGHMLSGWQVVETTNSKGETKEDLYYLGDENQGWAVTGWQQLEPREEDNEAYDELKWFYFDGGKAVKGRTKYITGAYYSFKDNGIMEDGWFDAATPPEPASGANAYASGAGALGTGWVYSTARDDSDGDEHWFYLVTVRDGSDVARSIPFNFQEKGTGDDKDAYRAKYIKNKTYIFDDMGRMKTGVIKLDETITADKEGTSKGSKELKDGIYYFNKADGSVKGQMVTGKVTVEEDGEKYYYYFATDGRAYTKTLKDGAIYDSEGKRVNAEDGSTYSIYETTTSIKDAKDVEVIPANKEVIVNSSGKVKKEGKVKIDGEYYYVKNYVIDDTDTQ